MAQDLPFLNLTEDDVKALQPINSQCTVLCEVTKIWAKEAKSGGTNIWFIYTCIDDNSPEKGHPSRPKCFPMEYKSMWTELLMALNRQDKAEIMPGPINLASFLGKQLMVKFDLTDNGRDEYTIQPVAYFRSDRPIV